MRANCPFSIIGEPLCPRIGGGSHAPHFSISIIPCGIRGVGTAAAIVRCSLLYV